MKIAIIGFSGSGKSTLARKIGEAKNIPVLHFDSVHFLPGWQIRPAEEKLKITQDFLNSNSEWVIDGNYKKLFFERRMDEADNIIILRFNRFASLWRVVKRYFKFKGTSRPDIGQDCNEKLDWEFVKWVLRDGRKRSAYELFDELCKKYPQKTIMVKNQRQLNKVYKVFGAEQEY